MPNPGIALGSVPAWLARLPALGQRAAEQTLARGSPAGGPGGLRDAPRTPQKFSTTNVDLDTPCTAWPTQPALEGLVPKNGAGDESPCRDSICWRGESAGL